MVRSGHRRIRGADNGLISRVNPIDIGMSACSRAGKTGLAVCDVPYDTVHIAINAIHVNKPKLPHVLLMDEILAYSCRDQESSKKVFRY